MKTIYDYFKIVRRFVLSAFVMSTASIMQAEEVLQILPQEIVAGSTSDDGRYFAIQLRNDENMYTAFQFDIYLPEGMDLDTTFSPMELSQERFPFTTGRGGQITWDHSIDWTKKGDRHYRFIVSSNINAKISGSSGDVLYAYYITNNTLPAEPMPVEIKGVVMAIDGNHDVKLPSSSSFFYTSDFNPSTSLDLSSAKGVMYTDVVNATNNLISSNEEITSVDITGLDDATAMFTSANRNCLFYIKEESQLAAREDVAVKENVVVSGLAGNICNSLCLTDGYPFCAGRDFIALNASYICTVPNEGWYSLCLPFKADTPDGVSVKRYTSFDENEETIYFEEGDLEADVPCIFNTEMQEIVFTASNTAVKTTPSSMAVEVFEGTYKKITSDENSENYILQNDGEWFNKVAEVTTIAPFQAYVSASLEASSLKIKYTSTGINIADKVTSSLKIIPGNKCITIHAYSDSTQVRIFTITGQLCSIVSLKPGESKRIHLSAGVYLVNDQKVIVK